MSFNFHYLGTNGFHSNEISHTACYMIPELGIVFDAGSGFFRVKNLVKTPYLELFFSHGHMDHMKGIHCLVEVLSLPGFEKVRIHAEQKVLDEIKLLFGDPFFPITIPLELVPLDVKDNDDENVINCLHEGAKIKYFKVKHTTSCIGYRLDYEGKSIAYVTDTTTFPDSPYLKYLNDLDFLFHEVHSLHQDGSEKFGHTDADNLIKAAKVVKPKKLVIIHHNPNGDRNEIFEYIKKEYPETLVSYDKEFVTI